MPSYVVTHHIRDVDRYMSRDRQEPKVYAVLRKGRPYASVTAFAGPDGFSPDTQRRMRQAMQEVSLPWKFGYERPPRISVDERSARAGNVDPRFAEWLCQRLATLASEQEVTR